MTHWQIEKAFRYQTQQKKTNSHQETSLFQNPGHEKSYSLPHGAKKGGKKTGPIQEPESKTDSAISATTLKSRMWRSKAFQILREGNSQLGKTVNQVWE